MLREHGLLVVMIERWETANKFKQWYYAKDPTHVSFYHNLTFERICSKFGFEKVVINSNRVVILQRKPMQLPQKQVVIPEEKAIDTTAY